MENWKEYPLGELLSYEQPTPYIVCSTKYNEKFETPVLTAGKSFIIGYTDESAGIYTAYPVIIFDDFTTSTQYVNFPFKVKSSAMKILSTNTSLAIPKFIYYRMQLIEFDHSTHKRYWIQQYSKIKVSIPEIPEQARIVAKLEELLSDLDASVAELNKAKQRLKLYRQAVLKQAFEGEYTQDTRKTAGVAAVVHDLNEIYRGNQIFQDTSSDENILMLKVPNEWQMIRFGEVFNVEVGATPSRKEPLNWDGDINWASSGEVRFCNIYETRERITARGYESSSTRIHPIGTVLLAMIGEGKTRGQAAILRVEAAHNQNTAAILVSRTPCVPEYIYYYLMLNYDHTRRVGSGNNQKALNKERVRAIKFPFTTFDEQKQIVQEIESRLSVCDNIEKTVDKSLLQSSTLRQSILKKAFEGKLMN